MLYRQCLSSLPPYKIEKLNSFNWHTKELDWKTSLIKGLVEIDSWTNVIFLNAHFWKED